jgi:hypothetical protein
MNYINSEYPPDVHQWDRISAEIIRAENRIRRYFGRCVLCDAGTPEHYLSCPFGVLATYGVSYEAPVEAVEREPKPGEPYCCRGQFTTYFPKPSVNTANWVRPSNKNRKEQNGE